MKKFLLLFAAVVGFAFASSAATATFDFTGDEAYGMTLLSGSASEYNPDPCVCTQDGVILTLHGRTRWWKTSSGNELRIYKESSFEFSAPDGKVITEIVIYSKYPKNFQLEEGFSGTYEIYTENDKSKNGTWTGSLPNVKFKNVYDGTASITKIEVTYSDPDGLQIENVLGNYSVKNREISWLDEDYNWTIPEDFNDGFAPIYQTGKNSYSIFNAFYMGETISIEFDLDNRTFEIPVQNFKYTDSYDDVCDATVCKKPESFLSGYPYYAQLSDCTEPVTGTINLDGSLSFNDDIFVWEEWEGYAYGIYIISNLNLTSKSDLLNDLVVSPEPGKLDAGSTITLTAGNNQYIYYTLDGSVPNIYSELYDEPIELWGNIELNVWVTDFENCSEVWSGNYYAVNSIDNFNCIGDLGVGSYVRVEMDLTTIYEYDGNIVVSNQSNPVSGQYDKNGLIYLKNSGIKANDIIAKGWLAYVKDFYGMLELIPEEALTVSGQAKEAPEPTQVEAIDAEITMQQYNAMGYFKFIDVLFVDNIGLKASSGDMSGYDEEYDEDVDFTLNIYNDLGAGEQKAGLYDVTGFVWIYEGKDETTVELKPCKFDLKTNFGVFGSASDKFDKIIEFTKDEDGYYTYTTEEEIEKIYLSMFNMGEYIQDAMFAPTVELENDLWTGIDSSDEATVMPWKGVYTITVDLFGQMMKVYTESEEPTTPDDPSGIEAIEAENANATYFNLQGIKVENPAAGSIVIRVLNGNAQKVMIK